MQTVYSRPFSFLGHAKPGRALPLGVLALVVGGMTGCSSTEYAQAPVSSGTMAARDSAPMGVMSMAAGDRLGMAVYAQDAMLARRDAAERTRVARHSSPAPSASPTVASAGE